MIISTEQQVKYDALEQEINDIAPLMDTPEFKKSATLQAETYHKYLKLRAEQNLIKPHNNTMKAKIKIINGLLDYAEKMQELKNKGSIKYIRMKKALINTVQKTLKPFKR